MRFIRYFVLVLIMCGILLPFGFLLTDSAYASDADAYAVDTVNLGVEQWEYRTGDSPFDKNGKPNWTKKNLTSSEWRPLETNRLKRADTGHYLWLRTKLPEGGWADPTLRIQMNQQFEIYNEQGALVYRFGDFDSKGGGTYQGTPPRIVHLSREDLGHSIYVRVYSDNQSIGIMNQIRLGNSSSLIIHMVRSELHKVVLAGLYIFMGLMAAYVYYRFELQKPFLSFSCFSFFMGIYTICRLSIIYLFADMPRVWMYIEINSLVLGLTGIIAFIRQSFVSGRSVLLKYLWQAPLALLVPVNVLCLLRVVKIPNMLAGYQIFILFAVCVCLYTIFDSARKGNHDARYIMAGAIPFALLSIEDLLETTPFKVIVLPWFSALPSLTYLGIFIFIFSIFIVLMRRMFIMLTQIRDTEKLTLVGQLAAGVAHEIRNPITVISGFLQLMKKDPHNRSYLEIMMSEVNRINLIISEFLLLAKPSVIKFEQHNIKEIVEEILPLFQNMAEDKLIDLTVECPEVLPMIQCERNQLKQVFINVIKNSIEAMKTGGEIKIIVKLYDKKRLLIRFVDQGVGIPADKIAKLGQPFYTTKENGTGLGLMVSHKIIDCHGGRILINSKLKEGTTVDVLLPIRV